MREFDVKIEYNPTTLDDAVDITLRVHARHRTHAERGIAHLAQKLRSVGVEGLRVTEVQEVGPPPDLL